MSNDETPAQGLTMPQGLRMSIYSHPRYRACTTGPTKTVDEITIIGTVDRRDDLSANKVQLLDRAHRAPFRPEDQAPAFALVARRPYGPHAILSVEPATQQPDGTWTTEGWHSAGGSYAGTTDSRFGELTEHLTGQNFYGAVSVHDRREW